MQCSHRALTPLLRRRAASRRPQTAAAARPAGVGRALARRARRHAHRQAGP